MYYHVYENALGPLPVPGVDKGNILSIRRLADGTEAPLSTSWVHSDYPDVAFVNLGPDPVLPDETDTVLEIQLRP